MAPMQQIASGLRFPEGPVAMPDGSLVLAEIEARRITRIAADGTKTVIARIEGAPNGLAMGPGGYCYIANNGGFKYHDKDGELRSIGPSDDYTGGHIDRIDLKTGKVDILYREVNGHKLSGPNDLCVDKDGGIWFTDLGKRRHHSRDSGGVFYCKADGSLIKEIAYPSLSPNGIGLSPDGSVLYVAETETSRLWAYDIVGPGEVKLQPWPSPHGGRLICGLPGFQRFDSLAVEANGNICVGTLVRGGVTVISPDGKVVDFVPTPQDPMCTNICFGGPDLKTAYLTLSLYGTVAKMDWPRPGLPLPFLNT